MSYRKMDSMSLMCGFECMMILIQNPVQRGLIIGVCVGKYMYICTTIISVSLPLRETLYYSEVIIIMLTVRDHTEYINPIIIMDPIL